MKIFIDAGHGGNDPGAVGNGLKEKDLTLEAAMYIGKRLELLGHTVGYSRKTDVNAGEVSARGRMAKGYDYFLSVHFNAGGGAGTEVYCNTREKYAATGVAFKENLTPLLGFRGVKSRYMNGTNAGRFVTRTYGNNYPHLLKSIGNVTDYFGVLRGCWSVGVSGDLIEIAFIDTASDMKKYLDNKTAVLEGIVKAIMQAFKQEYKAPSTPPIVKPGTDKWYKVFVAEKVTQKGAFQSLENAEQYAEGLAGKGEHAFVEEGN